MLSIRYHGGIPNKPRFVGFHIGYKVEVRSRRWSVGTKGVCLRRLRRSRTTCLSFKKLVESRISFRRVEKVLKFKIFFDFKMGCSCYQLFDLGYGIDNEIFDT